MNRQAWLAGVTGALVLAGSSGCYYDQWKQEERANNVLREDLSRAKADLQDCEAMNRQKDTEIAALQKTTAEMNSHIASLQAENEALRKNFDEALRAALEAAQNPPSPVIIHRGQLPEQVVNKIKELADRYPNILEFDEKTGAVRWKADLLFPLGSDAVATSADIQDALKRFAEIVQSPEAAGLDLIIVGHTCTTPIVKPATLAEHKTNWHLSAHRAIAVMNMLAGTGVDRDRMGVMGYGEYRPIAGNDTPAGKARNRRVEIYLVPKGSVQSVSSAAPGVNRVEGTDLNFVRPSELPGARRASAGRDSGRVGTASEAPAGPISPVLPPPNATEAPSGRAGNR